MTYYSALHYATKAEAAADATAPVVSHLTEIDTVANNISDVSTVAGVSTEVAALGNVATDIPTVAAIDSDVSTVAGISTDVSTVAGVSSDVNTVAGVSTDVSTVATNISDVSTVAGISSDISSVAAIDSDVSTVASNVSDISTVATDIANVNAVAGDLTNIDNASTYAAEAKQWAIGDPSEPVDGSAKYWAQQAAGQVIPSQTGHSGEYLTTDGTTLSWDNVDALPDQTGQAGKYLTTDGTDASWDTLIIPSVDVDGISINRNTDDELQTIGVINQNDTTTAIKTWSGTKAQYDAIVTKDANTLYNITDDTDISLTILEALYPVGSIYETTNATCPLSTLIAGSTWVQETSRVLVEKKEPTDSDPTWYNLYSDGWCEQGGVASNSNYGSWQTVTLLKPYTITNFTINGNCFQTQNDDGGYESCIKIVSPSQFKWVFTTRLSTARPCHCIWRACGYTSTTTSHKQFRRTA